MKKENTTAFAFKGFEKFVTIEQEVLKNIIGGDIRREVYKGLFGRK